MFNKTLIVAQRRAVVHRCPVGVELFVQNRVGDSKISRFLTLLQPGVHGVKGFKPGLLP